MYLEDVYSLYRHDAESIGEEVIHINSFARAVTKFFNCIKVKKIQSETKKKSCYQNVEVKNREPDITISFHEIPSVIEKLSGIYIVEESTNEISIHCSTTMTIDDEPVYKIVIFRDDLNWMLKVDDVNVDLTKLSIRNKYELNESQIEAALKIASKIRLCYGQEMHGCNYAPRTSCLQTIHDSATGVSKETSRSKTCCRVISFFCSDKSEVCRACYKYPIHVDPSRQCRDEVDKAFRKRHDFVLPSVVNYHAPPPID